MDKSFIKDLALIMGETGLSQLEYTKGDASVKLKKGFALEEIELCKGGFEPLDKIIQEKYQSIENEPKARNSEICRHKEVEVKSQSTEFETVKSNTIGTFYSKPDPESDAFVEKGKSVKKGEVLCILEAMKLMNEIKAPFDCQIEDILVSDGEVVEFGQELFKVKKS